MADLIDDSYQFLINLTKEAGKLVVEGFNGVKNVETKGGVSYDLVTEYDKMVEEVLISKITEKFPDHLFIGEESTAEANRKPILTDKPTWIIDPIDGTTNFVHGLPLIGISVALAVNQEVIVGVVYNPIINQLFSAAKGRGAFLNDKRIHSSKVDDLDGAVITAEISLAKISFLRARTLERIHRFTELCQGVRSLGSAALTLCYVASGGLDGYFMDGLQCWDVAAGVLILEEAGGHVCSPEGEKYDMFARKIAAAGNVVLAEKMVAVLKECDAKTKK